MREALNSTRQLTIHDRGDDPDEKEEHGEYVHLSPPGSHQGTPDVGNHSPIECEETHAEASAVTEELVHHDVLGCDPAHPSEH